MTLVRRHAKQCAAYEFFSSVNIRSKNLFIGTRPHDRPAALLLRLVALVIEHAHFGALRTLAFLPANLRDALRFGTGGAALL